MKREFDINDYDLYYDLFIEEINTILTNNLREIESKQKTNRTYQSRLRVLLNYLKKNKIDIRKLDKYDVEKMFKRVQSNGYTINGVKKVYSKTSMKLLKVVSKKFFEFLKAERIIDRDINNPFSEKVDYLKSNKNVQKAYIKDKILTVENINAVIDYIRNQKNKIRDIQKLINAILLMLTFGLRVSELGKIERSDFELGERIKLHIKPSKRGKERDTYYIFKDRYREDVENIIKNSNLNFNVRTIEKQIERIAKRLGIPNLSTHSFRHTYATTFISMNGSIETLSKLLGHDDIKTTQIYAKILDVRIENEIDNLKDLAS